MNGYIQLMFDANDMFMPANSFPNNVMNENNNLFVGDSHNNMGADFNNLHKDYNISYKDYNKSHKDYKIITNLTKVIRL